MNLKYITVKTNYSISLHETLGKTELWWRKIDQSLPGVRGHQEEATDHEKHKVTFQEEASYHDCGGPHMNEHICWKSLNHTLKRVSFVICKLYLNKANKKFW